MLIIYAGLQAIPADLYEAARLDGASEWRVAARIKLPLVTGSLVLTGVFSLIGTLQLFAEPQVLRSVTDDISGSRPTCSPTPRRSPTTTRTMPPR